MPEEIKKPPEETKPEVTETPKETGKSAEEKLKEAEEKTVKLEKQLQDKDTFIGKQSTEIGELRTFKSDNQELIEKAETAKGEKKDELTAELSLELQKDGMGKDDADFNAKILAKGTNAVLDRREQRRMEADVVDMIDDAIEDKKIDGKIYSDNKAEIVSEFKKRRLAPSARKNFRTFKECYDLIVKRKADTMRETEQKKDEEERQKLIGSGAQPSPGQKTQIQVDEEKKATDKIKNAGGKRSSAFF